MIRCAALTLFAVAVFQVGCQTEPKTVINQADLEESTDVERSALTEETPNEELFVHFTVEPKLQVDLAKHQISEEWLNRLAAESQTFNEEVQIVPMSLDTKLEVDSLTKYLNLRFPYRRTEYGDVVVNIIQDIDDSRYQTLKQIDDAMNSTEALRNQIWGQVGSRWAHDAQVPATAELIWALGCVDDQFRNNPYWDVRHETKKVIEELIDR